MWFRHSSQMIKNKTLTLPNAYHPPSRNYSWEGDVETTSPLGRDKDEFGCEINEKGLSGRRGFLALTFQRGHKFSFRKASCALCHRD